MILFDIVCRSLQARGQIMGRGTLVNATIKQAQANPSSQRDADTNVIHSVEFTPGKVHDSTVLDDLLTGEKESLFADKAYAQKNSKMSFDLRACFAVFWIKAGVIDH